MLCGARAMGPLLVANGTRIAQSFATAEVDDIN
jgi:hypothetical protein